MVVETKYGMAVSKADLRSYLGVAKNKVYKLLPLREEGLEWGKYLNSIIIELSGLNSLFDNKIELISVLSKLEALYGLEDDFMTYRKIIFECLNSIDDLR